MGVKQRNGVPALREEPAVIAAPVRTLAAPMPRAEVSTPAVSASEAPIDLLAWCETHRAKVSWYERASGQVRVRCNLDGGISYEGATLAEVVTLCEARLTRKRERFGRVS